MACRAAASGPSGGNGARPSLARNLPVGRVPFDSKRLDRTLDILEREIPQIIERGFEPASHCLMNSARDHDAAGRRLRLQPCGHVHAVAVEVVAFDDQVAEVQADAEDDAVSSG